ncbi:DNA adenine methylase [Pseudomonas amygdali]|uniref:DNA adenine methylase n=1 Tax=Pseudomonas amygdali TaxID=47877 RepID=UPI000E3D604B|nr:DNA adenine methylase [Pseudomonas amygdali]
MAIRVFSTPLRYPGGKGKFSHFIKDVVEENQLLDGHYVEPYAGGAGVALELLFHEYASKIHINDIDPAIYTFWNAAVFQTEELCKKIYDTEVTMDNWHLSRKILNNIEDYSSIEIAAATFFLNRTNRSGILKAGVIGGIAQSGKWKLDERFNKTDLIRRIELIGRYSNRIHVYNLDAVTLLEDVVPTLPKKTLVYLDPPYYIKGSGLYRNFYEHDDHVRIEKALQCVTKPWIVSYDNVDKIKQIYKNYRQDEYFLSYTAQLKKKGSEVMIYGPGIAVPKNGLHKKITPHITAPSIKTGS